VIGRKNWELPKPVFFAGARSTTNGNKTDGKASVLASPRTEGNNTPLKVYELLASGKPMFANNIYLHTQVLKGDVAFLVDPASQSIDKGILDSISNIDVVKQRVINARKLFEAKYSRKVYESKICNLLDRFGCGNSRYQYTNKRTSRRLRQITVA